MTAIRALSAGLVRVLAAPGLIILALGVMVLITAPFAAVVGNELQDALASQQPISRDAGDIDPEWWYEYRRQATGLMATFTPAIIGFAAPLDNLSAMFDGTRRPLAVAAPMLLALVAWAFLWGAALHRYAAGSSGSAIRAGARTMTRFVGISLVAAIVIIAMYVAVHPVLIGPLARATSPLVAYAIIGVWLAAVGLVADYARVAIAAGTAATVFDALREAARFLRAHPGSVLALYVMTGLLFVLLLAVFGVVDLYGGTRVAGWRGIAIAQAYIVARLVIRLTFGASEIQLYRALSGHSAS